MNKFGTILTLIYFTIVSLVFTQTSNQLEIPGTEEVQTPILYREYGVKSLPLEKPINPDEYFLGPGDRLRVNISSAFLRKKYQKNGQ